MADDKTPVFDWEKGDFVKDAQGAVVTAVEGQAVAQIAVKALQTERGLFPIYATPENPATDHKYGTDAFEVIRADLSQETKIEELKRTTREALIYLDGVTSVSEMTVVKTGDEVDADLAIETPYDTVKMEGVRINNG